MSILATRIRVWSYDLRIPLDFCNRIILRIYIEGLHQFPWRIYLHWRTICFLSSNWFLFFLLLYSYNANCSDQDSFQFFFWTRFLVEAFDENFSKLDSLLDIIKLWLWTNDNDKIEFRNSNSGCNSDSVRFRKMLHARTLIRYQDRKSDWLAADWTESFWNWSSLSPCQQFQRISQRSIFG